MKTSTYISHPKTFNYSFKILLALLIVALITFSVQWYDAWIEVQEVQQRLTLE